MVCRWQHTTPSLSLFLSCCWGTIPNATRPFALDKQMNVTKLYAIYVHVMCFLVCHFCICAHRCALARTHPAPQSGPRVCVRHVLVHDADGRRVMYRHNSESLCAKPNSTKPQAQTQIYSTKSIISFSISYLPHTHILSRTHALEHIRDHMQAVGCDDHCLCAH